MIWKIIVFFLVIWLFFKIFGKRILLYFVKKIVKKLEQQTLKDMKHFQNLYDEKARQSFHLNDEYSVIVPEHFENGKKKKNIIIEEVEFEEIPKDPSKNEGNFTH